MHWDDLKSLLVVYRAGTVAAAARRVGIDQVTLGRRLRRLEAQLGQSLFVRAGSKLTLTDVGQLVIAHAERMEVEAERLADDVDESGGGLKGSVRIATAPWIVDHVLIPSVPLLRLRHPGIELHTVSSVRHYNLSAREVDLSLRFDREPHGREVCRVVGTIAYACFRSKHAMNSNHSWVGYGEEFRGSVVERWIEERRDGKAYAVRVANEGAAYQAIRSGIGFGLIPENFAERDPDLVRVSGPEADIVRELKLLFHPDIGRVARVAAVIGWIEEIIPRRRNLAAHNSATG